jgi:hypothetical protein
MAKIGRPKKNVAEKPKQQDFSEEVKAFKEKIKAAKNVQTAVLLILEQPDADGATHFHQMKKGSGFEVLGLVTAFKKQVTETLPCMIHQNGGLEGLLQAIAAKNQEKN